MRAHIAYVERAALDAFTLPHQGYLHDEHGIREQLAARLAFAERGPLETDPSRKQLIPYIVLGSPDRVFVTRRTRAQTEARLHDKLSFGVGGHMEREDLGDGDPIVTGAIRELTEELVVGDALARDLVFRGIINDDTSEVGSVHLGIVYSLRVPEGTEIEVREKDKMTGEWMSFERIRALEPRLETWSALLLPMLEAFFERE